MTTFDPEAKEYLNKLTEGLDFSIPDVDFNASAFSISPELADALKGAPNKLDIGTLTERKVDGNGAFDAIMSAMKAHLMEEYEKGRITGAEYTKAYTAMMQYALQFAVQYLLGKDTAFYQALGAQAAAITANIDAYSAKVRLAIAQAQAHINRAQFAEEVLKLVNIDRQTKLVEAQTESQKQQKLLLIEQTDQARSQVSDTRVDGSPVMGYTGRQNDLLRMQVQAFKNDNIIKGAKIFADAASAQMSMGIATAAGTGLDASGVNNAITKLQASIAKSSS